MTVAPVIQLDSVTKTFGPVQALAGVTFDVCAGEVHAVCGENGAGKSTLMKIISGVYPHGTYGGDIHLDGQEMQFSGIADSEAAGIAIIHQELTLCPNLSIAENICLGHHASNHGVVDWRTVHRAAEVLLDRVGLQENPATLASSLGVGKQQLVEIAKALGRNARILLLDEPTAALNDFDATRLLELIDRLRAEGTTCILISHKLNEIRRIADSVTILRDGHSVMTLPLADPAATDDRIIEAMVGREIGTMFPSRRSVIGEPRLTICDWTVRHPVDRDRLVVDSASLDVRSGEVVGLAGLIGAGRTELAMSVFGRSYGRYIGGTVVKDGHAIDIKTVSTAIENGLAYVSEDRKTAGLNLISSIAVNICAAGRQPSSRWGVVDGYAEHTVAERFRHALHIRASSVSARVDTLSGGNQQKVSLAKWIRTDPDVLILDEPTRGIDIGAKAEVYELINGLAESGKAIVIISSELPELLGVCDRIFTLCEGRVTAELDARSTDQRELMKHMTNNVRETSDAA